MTDEHGDEGYTGDAVLVDGQQQVKVRAVLRGYFQPIDGFFHWYGRIAANPELASRVAGNRADVVLRTPKGERPGELSDPDVWGRFRISGESTPPFDVELDVPAEA